jgi:hypothetical protein
LRAKQKQIQQKFAHLHFKIWDDTKNKNKKERTVKSRSKIKHQRTVGGHPILISDIAGDLTVGFSCTTALSGVSSTKQSLSR